jgi:hypothetical protein
MKRIGRFFATHAIVYSEAMPKILAKMEFVPLRVEYMEYMRRFEFIGLSPMFEEKPDGYVPKTYTMTITEALDDEGSMIDFDVSCAADAVA